MNELIEGYWYPTEPEMWEILEDPTGMAYETIYGGKNFMSKKEWDHVIEQFKKMENENTGD